MDQAVERELELAHRIEEVWRSLSEPGWLGEDAAVDLREAGDVRAGERSGFVEEVDAPRRLVFWWSEGEDEPSRVEIDLEETDAGTRVRVTESRPLEVLDGRDLSAEWSGGAGPVALAGAGSMLALR